MNFLFKGSYHHLTKVVLKGRMMRCAGNSKYGAAGTRLYLSQWMGVCITELCPAVTRRISTPIFSNFSVGVDEENRQLSNGVLS
jgi:hypothetical protein